jgi:hypothetical protein
MNTSPKRKYSTQNHAFRPRLLQKPIQFASFGSKYWTMERVEAFRKEVIRLVNETTDIVIFGRVLRILREKDVSSAKTEPMTIEMLRAKIQKGRERFEMGLYYTSDEVRELWKFRKLASFPKKRCRIVTKKEQLNSPKKHQKRPKRRF